MTIDTGDRFARARLPSFSFGEITRAGTNPTLILASDFPVAVGHDGNLYYPLLNDGKRLQILRLTPTGQTSVLATLAPSTDGGRPLRWVNGIAAGADNALYFTENSAIKKVTQSGAVSTVATVRLAECSRIPGTDEGPYLRGLDVDAHGTVYVAASGCGSLLKITPDGRVTTLLRTQSPWSPTGVAVSGAGVYVLEYLHTASDNRREWLPRVRKLSPDGKIVTIAAIERRQG
jgi:sugar lactone lactonase YvrE